MQTLRSFVCWEKYFVPRRGAIVHGTIDGLFQGSLFPSGMDIDEACANLGMNEEQKFIVGLILARDCYLQSNYRLGDQYLKKVGRTKNKSKLVKLLFEEVRKNKKFYRNGA